MAKARVELICDECGRTYTREKVCYNRREADEWVRWMDGRGGLCPECYEAKRILTRDEADRSFAASHPLPELTGSEKQVAWATTIRRKVLTELEAFWAEDGIPDLSDPLQRTQAAGQQAFMSWVSGQGSARWWIDHRPDVMPAGRNGITDALFLEWPEREAWETRIDEVAAHA